MCKDFIDLSDAINLEHLLGTEWTNALAAALTSPSRPFNWFYIPVLSFRERLINVMNTACMR